MPDDLYQRDILVWAERQAALLRRLAAGERVNDALDWPRLIDEVSDVGLSELRVCESLLRQAIVHLLKLARDPGPASAHWRGEVVGFLSDAQARFTPSMRQRLDIDRIYRVARRQVVVEREGAGVVAPSFCPFVLDDLLAEEASIDALVRQLIDEGQAPPLT